MALLYSVRRFLYERCDMSLSSQEVAQRALDGAHQLGRSIIVGSPELCQGGRSQLQTETYITRKGLLLLRYRRRFDRAAAAYHGVTGEPWSVRFITVAEWSALLARDGVPATITVERPPNTEAAMPRKLKKAFSKVTLQAMTPRERTMVSMFMFREMGI